MPLTPSSLYVHILQSYLATALFILRWFGVFFALPHYHLVCTSGC